jgi:two-component system chemotaxis response regulator CheB
MAEHDIVVVGASAGGVESLIQLVSDLPEDYPGAVFIVLHMAASSGTALPHILARRSQLQVAHPGDGDEIEGGRVYVAVPDRHLALQGTRIGLLAGPKENGHRPAVDTLFRTAAASFGRRVVGVILSGTRDDGTAGLRAIHERGGYAIVQDPDEALFPGMPLSALAGDSPDIVLPVGKIADHLVRLTEEPPRQAADPETSTALDAELRWAHPDVTQRPAPEPPLGHPSGFTCPECHGALWEIDDGGLPRYRCRVGHGFSPDTLLVTQGSAVDAALWIAYRALEERVALCGRLADRAESRRAGLSAEYFRAEAAEAGRQAETLRGVLWAKGPSDASESGSTDA